MKPEKKKKRRRKGRVVYIMFDEDGDACSVSSDSSLPSVVMGPDDFDVGDGPGKKYKRVFLALATIAIFFGLYYPNAVMKSISDGRPAKGLRHTQNDGRAGVEKKKKHMDRPLESDTKTDQEPGSLKNEDDQVDPDSKLDFDTFLQKQEQLAENRMQPVQVKTKSQDPVTVEKKSLLNVHVSLTTQDESKHLQQLQRIQREKASNHPIVVGNKDQRFSGTKGLLESSSTGEEHPKDSESNAIVPFSTSLRDWARENETEINGQGRLHQEQGNLDGNSLQSANMRRVEISDSILALPPRNNRFEVSDHNRQVKQSRRGYLSNSQTGEARNYHRRLAEQREWVNDQSMVVSQGGGRFQDVGQEGHVQQDHFPAAVQDEGQPLSLTYGPEKQQLTQSSPQMFNQENEQYVRSIPLVANQQNSDQILGQQNQQSVQNSPQILNSHSQQPIELMTSMFGQQNEQSLHYTLPIFDQQHQTLNPPAPHAQGKQSQMGMPQTFGEQFSVQEDLQMPSKPYDSSESHRTSDQESMGISVRHQLPDSSKQILLEGGINGAHGITGNDHLVSHHSNNQQHNRPTAGLPSYAQICSIVLGGDPGEMLQENQVCLDQTDPTLSLAHIFLSSYLAQKAREHAFRVDYQHNCGGHRAEPQLIQELLPSPLLSSESVDDNLSVEQLQSFCVLVEENAKKGSQQATVLDMLLWDTTRQQRRLSDAGDPSIVETAHISMLERLVPLVQANLYHASMMSRAVKSSLKAGYGVLKGRDMKSEKAAVGRAVIYLPCRDHKCQDLVLVPYISYLMHLPFSVHIIDIVAPPECMNNLAGCRKYVEDLASTTRQFIPQMSVEVISAEPSSPDVIDRLIEAEHVICGPGFGSTCLFPALGKEGGRVTLFDVGPDQIEGESASSFVARLPPELIQHINPPTSSFNVAALSSFGTNQDKAVAFAQREPDKATGDCRFARGRYGVWTQDMIYAEHAQYRTPLSHYSGNAEKFFRRKAAQGQYGDLKHRPSTTYRWDELRYQSCQVSQITQEGICDVLESLGVKRIFILGDSLNLQLAQSMWMWLTTERFGDSPTIKGQLDPNFSTKIQCPGYGSYTLQFIRNDELLENDEPVSIDNDQKNCGTYCFPWTEEYLKNRDRTILLVNAGAHIHEKKRFEAAIDRFVETFDGMNRPNDIVLFRTLVPGHWDCSRPGLKPFLNYAAYLKDMEEHPNPKDEIYSWTKFSEYNDYAIRALDQRRFLPPDDRPRALMEILDVFPMTVLRPDGHCSDEFRPPAYLDTDCLHYTLAGPIDWWSHLAYSHLLDIATAETFLATQ